MNLGMECVCGGWGGAAERGTEDCPAVLPLRSPSVERCRGETEDNFVRRNVREQSWLSFQPTRA